MQGCADGKTWGGRCAPLIFSNLQESWSKVSQAAMRVGHSIFCDLFVCFSNNLVTIGQLVRTPPPQQKVPRHITIYMYALEYTHSPPMSVTVDPYPVVSPPQQRFLLLVDSSCKWEISSSNTALL